MFRSHLLRARVLAASQPLVQENLNLNASVSCASGSRLVGGYGSHFSHSAKRHDVPNRNVAVLEQICNYVLRALHAQFLVHCRVAAGIGIALHSNDIALNVDGIVGQLFQAS